MDAEGVLFRKERTHDGFILEVAIWRVPLPVPGSTHTYKYRLFFGLPGERLVGFDNERGKGDHRHHRSVERRYEFVDIDTLLHDFEAEIAKWRNAR